MRSHPTENSRQLNTRACQSSGPWAGPRGVVDLSPATDRQGRRAPS